MSTIKRAAALALMGLRWLLLGFASLLTVAADTLQDAAERLRP